MKTACWLPLLAMMLCGCTRNVYEIELSRDGNALERKLTVRQQSRGESEPPAAFDGEVKHIAQIYHVAPPASGKSHVFRGSFAGRMPDDVGGYGTFTQWDTPLGSVSVYVERFRGNDDLSAVLKRREATADRVVELAVAWLATELKGDPQWPALQRFLEENFRRDLHNLTIYAWSMSLAHKADTTDENVDPFVRILQYLVERGYLEPDEIPKISRAVADCERGEYDRLTTWFSGFLAARMRGDAPRFLENLATPEALAKSLTAFLETTDEFAELQRKWREKLKRHPDVEKPDGMSVASELAVKLLFGDFDFELSTDQLTVALKTSRAPMFTNGRWSAESGTVRWREQPLTRDGFPPILYAAWDDPAEERQKRHFGVVALHGKALIEFCLWYRGLTAGERDEWDSFIDGLRPGPELKKALNEFRFADEPDGRLKDQRLASATVAAILKGLNERR
jgi:hypothetical protein